jgi:hypothetical protein
MFVLTWALSEAPQPVRVGMERLGYDLGAYIAIEVAFLWTASVIPVAYLIERYAGPKLSGLALRRLMVAGCALVAYATTFLFAYPIALTEVAFAFLAGGSVYGSLFKLKRFGRGIQTTSPMEAQSEYS